MKVGVFTSHNLWSSHFETELELIKNHVEAGDEVVEFGCYSEFSACDQNIDHDILKCWNCCSKKHKGLKAFPNVRSESYRRYLGDSQDIDLPKEFENVDNLKEFTFDEFDVGQAVASSLISVLRSANFDTLKHKKLIYGYLKDSIDLYQSTQYFIQKETPELIYAFNGRFAHSRAVFRACQKLGVQCFLHERGQDVNHYSIFKNHLPHSIQHFTRNSNNLWHSESEDPAKAEQFFNSRRYGKNKDWYSFIDHQIPNKLPSEWNDQKRNFVIFNSSEDEVAAIDEEWRNRLYENQVEGIRHLAESLLEYPDIRLFLRLHPNLMNASKEDVSKYYDLKFDNLVIINPDSQVSSYDLMEQSEKVITFGSTVGIEAVYWGKPSILLGRAFYEELGGTYNPGSHQEAIQMLLEECNPLLKEAAFIYGNYFMTFGIPFKYVKAVSFDNVKFENIDLYTSNSSVIHRVVDRSGLLNSLLNSIARRFNIFYYLYR